MATWQLEHEHCVKTAAKFVELLSDARKSVFLKVEAAVVSCVGIQIKKTGRVLEVDGYSQITGFKDLILLKATLEDPLSAPGLVAKLAAIAATAPALPPTPPVVSPLPVPQRAGSVRAAAAANPHAPVPTAKTPELDVLSPIADHATADYAAILDGGNLNDVEVLKELVRKSVVPALHYANTKIFGECKKQVQRMEAASVLGPIHVQGNGVDEADVDRLVSRYRFFGLPRFTGLPAKMKEELPAYRAAVAMIKPLEEREDAKGNDTFDMEAWWKSQRGDLRAWASVLRAVLCHVPNSCPPERAFSILNDCIDDGQYNAFADYKKAMVMAQYNSRGR